MQLLMKQLNLSLRVLAAAAELLLNCAAKVSEEFTHFSKMILMFIK